MTTGDYLKSALQKIQWGQHVDEFVSDPSDLETIGNAAHRIGTWCNALSLVESGNPAVSFLAQTQVESHYIAALIPLSLYKPAAASMRTAFESVLYYSYFRSHTAELRSLVRDAEYYVSKNDIIDFHKTHTPEFRARQEAFGLISRINFWYSRTSAIIHGQLPGKWVTHSKLADLRPDAVTKNEALLEFSTAAEIISHFLLCSIDADCWSAIDKQSKQYFLKGISGSIKEKLNLSIL